jgi:hypothetical protein
MTNFLNAIKNPYNLFITEIQNKKYTWENNSIEFLEKFEMSAFGKGYYAFIDKHSVIAKFGDRIYTITFNENYSTFCSIRTYDLKCIN